MHGGLQLQLRSTLVVKSDVCKLVIVFGVTARLQRKVYYHVLELVALSNTTLRKVFYPTGESFYFRVGPWGTFSVGNTFRSDFRLMKGIDRQYDGSFA